MPTKAEVEVAKLREQLAERAAEVEQLTEELAAAASSESDEDSPKGHGIDAGLIQAIVAAVAAASSGGGKATPVKVAAPAVHEFGGSGTKDLAQISRLARWPAVSMLPGGAELTLFCSHMCGLDDNTTLRENFRYAPGQGAFWRCAPTLPLLAAKRGVCVCVRAPCAACVVWLFVAMPQQWC